MWRQSFQHLDWEALCAGLKKDVVLKKSFKQAQETIASPSSKSWHGSDVSTETRHVLEVARHFLCLSEKELRKQVPSSKESKLPKSVLATLPSIQLPGPDGEIEEVFLFKHPQFPFRTATLRSSASQAMSTGVMSASNHNYEQQALDVFKHTQSQCIDEQGVRSLCQKEPHMLTLEEFCGKNFFKKLQQLEPNNEAASDEELEEEDDTALMNLVGAAAPSLARVSSSASLGDLGMSRAASFQTPKSKPSRRETSMQEEHSVDDAGSVSGKDSLLTSMDKSSEKKGQQGLVVCHLMLTSIESV